MDTRDIPTTPPGRSVLTVGKQGRVVIPASLRAQLGYEEGTRLHAFVDGGELHLLPYRAVVERARDMLGIAPWKPGDERASDALIAERRREAASE